MNSSVEITKLLTDDDNNEMKLTYTEEKHRYLVDINNGVYPGRQIHFDTRELVNDLIVWANAYIQLDINVTNAGGGVAYTRAHADRIAIRNNIASMIESVLIRVNNVTVSSQRDHRRIELIRALIDESFEREQSTVEFLNFKKENIRNIQPFNQTNETTIQNSLPIVSTDWTQATGAVPLQEYADGFNERLRKQDNSINGNIITYRVRIPMTVLSPLFKELDFPTTNLRWQLTITLNNVSSMFQKDGFIDSAYTAPASLIADPIEANPFITGPARLYYTSVTLDPRSSKLFTDKLNGGFKKTLKYWSHKQYTDPTPLVDGSVRDYQVTSGLSNIKRVWTLVTPRVSVGGVPVDQETNSLFPDLPSGNITNFNVILDNTQYYESDITDEYQLWTLLRDQCSFSTTDTRTSKVLTYEDFRKYYRLFVANVSNDPRSEGIVSLRVRLTSAPASYQGQVIFPQAGQNDTGGIPVTYRIHHIVEVASECSIDMKNGTVTSTEQ